MCLRVSPKAIASAFKSFHSLLTLNTEYGGQRRIVLATIITPQKPPCLFFSIFSAFRRRPQRQRPLLTDVVVLEFISRRDAETQRLKSQKFFRVISYHFVVPNSPKNLRASFSPFSPRFADGHSDSDHYSQMLLCWILFPAETQRHRDLNHDKFGGNLHTNHLRSRGFISLIIIRSSVFYFLFCFFQKLF